jgi:hypothetical protein
VRLGDEVRADQPDGLAQREERLACRADLRASMPEPLAARVAELRIPGALPPPVKAEVARIRSQLEAIEEACCAEA